MTHSQSPYSYVAYVDEEDVATGDLLLSIPLDLIMEDKQSPCAAIKHLRNELQRGRGQVGQVMLPPGNVLHNCGKSSFIVDNPQLTVENHHRNSGFSH